MQAGNPNMKNLKSQRFGSPVKGGGEIDQERRERLLVVAALAPTLRGPPARNTVDNGDTGTRHGVQCNLDSPSQITA